MDRFYPVGLASTKDAWKTTYEIMNELQTLERSAFPPGTSIHLPGARENFGYSCPAPITSRLAQPRLALSSPSSPGPREHHARTRIQVEDDRDTFYKYDAPEMLRTYNSPASRSAASFGFNLDGSDGRSSPAHSVRMTRGKSLTLLSRKPPPRQGSVEETERPREPYALPAPILKIQHSLLVA